jgi:DNA-directed RNA polymerase specialized sigma24 family protein
MILDVEDTAPSSDPARSVLLADPALRLALERFFAKRAPECDVADLVQATLTDALAAPRAPGDAAELRRWVHGIARNKVADLYRSRRREAPLERGDEMPAPGEPHDGRDLFRWATRELPNEHAAETLDWMLREGDGERLETIAREGGVPAPRVRQRIARLRRHFRARWAAQAALLAGIVLLAAGGIFWAQRALRPEAPPISEEPAKDPRLERARELRRAALEACGAGDYRACVAGLDDARRLDEAGDRTAEVRNARRAAANALAKDGEQGPAPDRKETPPSPTSVPAPSAAPSSTAPPRKPAPVNTSPAPTTPPNPAPHSKIGPKHDGLGSLGSFGSSAGTGASSK